MGFGSDKTKWLNKINEQYKVVMLTDIKKAQMKAKKKAEKVEKEAKEAARLARETEKATIETERLREESERQIEVEDKIVVEFETTDEPKSQFNMLPKN
jgi:hypothetical protein